MDARRQHVTICSKNESFNGALRLLLDQHHVDITSSPDETDEDSDILIWRIDGDVPPDQLIKLASLVPTLVLAEEDQLLRAVDAGCRGFLPSAAPLEEIREAVETIIDGNAVVPPDLLGTLLGHLVERRRHDRALAEQVEKLTDRELQVFRLAAQGARKEEIGERLFISPATARTHLQRIYQKLGVHSQSELIALPMRISEFEASDAE